MGQPSVYPARQRFYLAGEGAGMFVPDRAGGGVGRRRGGFGRCHVNRTRERDLARFVGP